MQFNPQRPPALPMSVTGKIRTLAAMPFAEKLAFMEAAVLLAYARILINFVPMAHWRKQVSITPAAGKVLPEPTGLQRETSLMIMRTIRRVGRNMPVEFVCLPQAFCARWMLRRRGIPSVLYLGTIKHAAEDREFHAWLKVGNRMITGHCDEEDYVVFGTQISR